MLFSTLAVAALGASTTLATPLLGSLSARNKNLPYKDGSLSHLNGRDVNNAESEQLPTCRSDVLYDLLTNTTNNLDTRAFCSIYIAVSSIVGVFATTTITGSVVMTKTAAINTVTATATPSNATNSAGPCSYSNTTAVSATSGLVNTTVTAVSPPLERQDAPTPPAFLAPYDPLRVSSVCSCLVTPSTIVQTWTSFVSVAWTIVTSIQSVTATVALQTPAGVSQPPDTTVVTTDSTPPTPTGSTGSITTSTLAPDTPAGSTDVSTVNITASPTNATEERVTVIPILDSTVGASFTMTIPDITADATATISVFPTRSTKSRSTLSIFLSHINATGTSFLPPDITATWATASVVHTNTATPGVPAPTGTNPFNSTTYCGQASVRGNGTFQARYTVRCGYSYTNLDPLRVVSRSSYAACVKECDNDSRCYAFSFKLSEVAENCYIYNLYPMPSGHSDVLFNSGAYVLGSNNGMKR
ncbi:hypothetical protein EPUS_05228 [Endocarpon pusillum Z07020]|uniref:Apple domain-containing protein n=1 Tax=Endocarpon pusillum (strain Z07020 / HMAS-L-300199) TaxID=1263415 RepID=U1HN00_ENDPU|nr:uncharacterized protein EPUS_05228 [Endocarpon pusillum Z07020]ERF70409.1 hypothetical protein EPUS_05228 [Endocarpon pusillum Z07020]